jgi:aminoglycoside phosphotransferase (APT) family kinase protein
VLDWASMGSAELARHVAEAVTGAVTGAAAVAPVDPPEVLSDRRDALVVRVDAVVAKLHAEGTDLPALRARLALAGAPGLASVLLAPCRPEPLEVAGRPVTTWPVGRPVEADDHDDAPWLEAAELLAALHTAAVPSGTPPTRWPVRLAESVDAMRDLVPDGPAVRAVREAYASVGTVSFARPALVHGDWHFGQLLQRDGRWWLIDVDELGVGDPAWDLARPAALFAVGVLAPTIWFRFLAAYAAAGGPAVPRQGDPWPALDPAARQATVLMAARGLATAVRAGREPDEIEERLVDACARMVHVPPPTGRMVAPTQPPDEAADQE